jgi:hypothetical protein
MITKFMVQTEDGDRLASREAFMIMHPARDSDCTLEEGDIIELEEGFFVLNDDLNPMELATEEQIASARERS